MYFDNNGIYQGSALCNRGGCAPVTTIGGGVVGEIAATGHVALSLDSTTAPSIRLDFENVTGTGTVVSFPFPPETTMSLPADFRAVDASREISTTAGYSGNIDVTLEYEPAKVTRNQTSLRLFHLEGADWHDVTASVDTSSHTVTGRVTSLSPFVILEASTVETGTDTSLQTLLGFLAILLGFLAIPWPRPAGKEGAAEGTGRPRGRSSKTTNES